MKKLFIILVAMLLSTMATSAQVLPGLSFTFWPEESGEFYCLYSTKNAPSTNVMQIDWGDGILQVYNEKAETGPDTDKLISGQATKGKPIKIYSDYIEGFYLVSKVLGIRCEANNPQLQYFYYEEDNLNPCDLEAFYLSLTNRIGKDWGELHLSRSASFSLASNNILKSNAFIALDKKWYVCSTKEYTGSFSERISWYMDETSAMANLIPAITLQTPTTDNITDLRLGIKNSPEYPYGVANSIIRIDDGTENYKSLIVSNYETNAEFINAPKLTVKGTDATGLIKIYGALVSHILTFQISALDLNNTNNLRYIRINNCNKLSNIPGLENQKLLEELDLNNNAKLTNVNVDSSPNLKSLSVGICPALESLYFDGTNLEYLAISFSVNLGRKYSNLQDATKLTTIYAENLAWNACDLDYFYGKLPNVTSDAKVYVHNGDISTSANTNGYTGSNKSIATDKGWSVYRSKNGVFTALTGDGGGCTFTYIPDENFLQALKDLGYGIGAVGNDIPKANISAIGTLNVSGKSISDLTGIQDFVALTYLNCSENNLTSLDLSKNTKLTELVCTNSELSTLDIRNGNNANVTNFDATNNSVLTCIYVNNKEASYLGSWKKDATANFANNKKECSMAYTLIPDNNFLQAIIGLGYGTGAVGNNIPTRNLNKISTLDVSGKEIKDLTGIEDFVALKSLECNGNKLKVLDVSKNTKLTDLDCYVNELSVLDVSENTTLTYLACQDNQLTVLDLSGNAALTILACNKNQLTVLDVSKNTALTHLLCFNNQLKVLDVSKNTALTDLLCDNNQLTMLDLSGSAALRELRCFKNKLPMLDVSNNAALEMLNCDGNDITSLDVSKNIVLDVFSCSGNQISIVDVSKNPNLTILFCDNNDLTSLDIRNGKNANVTEFDATNNPNLSCIYVDNKAASYLSGWAKDASAKFVNKESECGLVGYTHIPDANFLQALKDLGHGAGAVGNSIPTANLSAITTLIVDNKNISDLTGIQDFVALATLKCDVNNLSSLNVSINTNLIQLYCNSNKLETLDVSKNTKLWFIVCNNNILKTLDVSNNTKLFRLWCSNNQLTILDVSKNTVLEGLSCENNELTVLDVSKNTKLEELGCTHNLLTSLDIRNGNNEIVSVFNALNNPNLTCIYVDNKTASYLSGWKKDASAKFANTESDCGGTVAYTLILDANFLQALKDLGHGTGAVGNNIPKANLSAITTLEVSNWFNR